MDDLSNRRAPRGTRWHWLAFALAVLLLALVWALEALRHWGRLNHAPLDLATVAAADPDYSMLAALLVSGGLAAFFWAAHIRLVRQCQRAQDNALRDSQALLDALLEGATDAIFVKDRQGAYVMVNQATCQFFGRPRSAILGQDDRALLSANDALAIMDRDRAVMAEGRVQTQEERVVIRGAPRIFLSVKGPIRDANREVTGLFGIARDVTDRVAMETELAASERKFHTLFEGMSEGVALHQIIHDDQGLAVDYRILDTNPAYTDHTGIDRKQAQGTLASKLYGSGAPPFLTEFDDVARTGQAKVMEVEFKPLGRWFYISVIQTRPDQFATVFLDITAQKRIEQALRDSEGRFQSLFEDSPIPIWVLDCSGLKPAAEQLRRESDLPLRERPDQLRGLLDQIKVLNVNHAAATFHHAAGKLELLTRWRELLTPQATPVWMERVARLLDGRRRFDLEEVTGTLDGAPRTVVARWAVAVGHEQSLDLVVAAEMDMTGIRRREAQIRELNQDLERRVDQRTAQLEKANQELEAFSSSVSHDLRAPLRAMVGFTKLLAEEHAAELSPDARHCAAVIQESAVRMGQLIDDLLRFSKLSRLPMDCRCVDMTALVHEIVAEFREELAGRHVDLRVGPLPPCHGDPPLLRQVWANLLGNAIKFTKPQPQAVVEIGGSATTGECAYWIKDNGVGFDMAYYNHLFGVFQRLHTEREFPGTGIGLAIVKRLVERHGGQVRAEGAVGVGAEFHFSIPQQKDTAHE